MRSRGQLKIAMPRNSYWMIFAPQGVKGLDDDDDDDDDDDEYGQVSHVGVFKRISFIKFMLITSPAT
jgi:hypothetical protein